jgi:hypothetical protein
VRDASAFFQAPPLFQGIQTVAQNNLTSSIWATITLDTELIDDYGGHSTTTNTSRYTAQLAGWYEVSGSVTWLQNGTGTRGARLAVNGTVVQGSAVMMSTAASTTDTSVPTTTRVVYLNVGDYLEVQGWQSSGANLATKVDADLTSSLFACWRHA